jgi:lipid-A-disaccharide synthase-like uncharacterized protein
MVVGFAGQLMFTGRFLVQWLASEKKQDSVMPVSFWWLSIAGGLILLSYACYKRDVVIIFGQLTGVIVYARNLALIHARRKRDKNGAAERPETPAPRKAA